jgi:hypothetical protein
MNKCIPLPLSLSTLPAFLIHRLGKVAPSNFYILTILSVLWYPFWVSSAYSSFSPLALPIRFAPIVLGPSTTFSCTYGHRPRFTLITLYVSFLYVWPTYSVGFNSKDIWMATASARDGPNECVSVNIYYS